MSENLVCCQPSSPPFIHLHCWGMGWSATWRRMLFPFHNESWKTTTQTHRYA